MENVMSVKTEHNIATSTAIEAIAGVGVVIMAILALSSVYPITLTSIAAIAVGLAFLIQGLAISANYSDIVQSATETRSEAVYIEGGLSSEFIGGIAAITLGILSLINISPLILLPIAALVSGGVMILSSGETIQMGHLRYSENDTVRRITNSAIRTAAGAQLLTGLAAITLGIVALAGLPQHAFILSTIAILAVGVAEFSKGSALSTKMVNLLRRL
jgi:hypothetical protein